MIIDFFDGGNSREVEKDKSSTANKSKNSNDTDAKMSDKLPEGFFDDPVKDAKVK